MPLEFEVIPQGATLTDTGSGDFYVPYNTYYHDNRLQFVILASELQAAGMQPGDVIVGMKFRCGSSVPGRDLASFRIRLQNTDQTTSTSWVTTGWTLVYGPVTISWTAIAAGAWYQHDFSTPFVWDGRNLLVDVSRDDTAYTSGGGNYVYSNLTNRACGTYHDSSYSWPYDNSTPAVRNYILQTILVVDRPTIVNVPVVTSHAELLLPNVVTSTVEALAATVTATLLQPLVAGGGPQYVPAFSLHASMAPPVFTASGVACALAVSSHFTCGVPSVSGTANVPAVALLVQMLLSAPYVGVWRTIGPPPFGIIAIPVVPTHVGGLTSLLYELLVAGELDYVLALADGCIYGLVLNPEVVINLAQRN